VLHATGSERGVFRADRSRLIRAEGAIDSEKTVVPSSSISAVPPPPEIFVGSPSQAQAVGVCNSNTVFWVGETGGEPGPRSERTYRIWELMHQFACRIERSGRLQYS
jgi:hypothetical protein